MDTRFAAAPPLRPLFVAVCLAALFGCGGVGRDAPRATRPATQATPARSGHGSVPITVRASSDSVVPPNATLHFKARLPLDKPYGDEGVFMTGSLPGPHHFPVQLNWPIEWPEVGKTGHVSAIWVSVRAVVDGEERFIAGSLYRYFDEYEVGKRLELELVPVRR